MIRLFLRRRNKRENNFLVGLTELIKWNFSNLTVLTEETVSLRIIMLHDYFWASFQFVVAQLKIHCFPPLLRNTRAGLCKYLFWQLVENVKLPQWRSKWKWQTAPTDQLRSAPALQQGCFSTGPPPALQQGQDQLQLPLHLALRQQQATSSQAHCQVSPPLLGWCFPLCGSLILEESA